MEEVAAGQPTSGLGGMVLRIEFWLREEEPAEAGTEQPELGEDFLVRRALILILVTEEPAARRLAEVRHGP